MSYEIEENFCENAGVWNLEWSLRESTCADFRVSLKVNQSFLLAEYATFEVCRYVTSHDVFGLLRKLLATIG